MVTQPIKNVLGLILALSMVLVNSAAYTQNIELPELGDASAQYLNQDQEDIYGKEFLRYLLRQSNYVNDFELTDYMQTLGNRVGAHADMRGTPLTFNLLESNVLNAFAVPGGYITFHTGLVLNADTESELASVVGHEIAHLTQRHLPRMIARAQENRVPAILAVIGSILIGGQAGLAGLTATNAAMASSQLNYSRNFEREADSIGIRLLAESGFDPNGMAGFFGKLERFTRHDSTAISQFLTTHPLSYTRIAESEARAAEYPNIEHQSSLEFFLAKARIRAFYVERQDDPIEHFQVQIESGNPGQSDAAVYGLALWHGRQRELAKAEAILSPLLLKYPEHPWIQTLQAEIEFNQGKTDAAIQRIKDTAEKNLTKLFLNYYLADFYFRSGQHKEAKTLLRYQLRRHPNNYILYNYLAKTNAELGDLAEAHQAEAEYHAVLGNYKAAIDSLKLSRREAGSEGYLAQSINARLAELEEKRALQEKIIDG